MPGPRHRPRPVVAAIALALVAGGCDSSGGPPPAPAASAAPAAAPRPVPPPPTEKKPVTFTSEDGATLAGDLYLAGPEAPAVVLVHRLFGDRSEFAPLVELLRRGDQRYTVLAFDLRGHGDSKEPEQDPKSKKPARRDDSKAELRADVDAAIRHVLEAGGGKAPGVVLVGSSFGATLVSLVAFERARVTALALVSPGASIRGVDIYRPYSEVRNLPTFIAAAKEDTVAREPLDALARMAQRGMVKRYPGARHAAQFLGQEHEQLWKDLQAWLASVRTEKPVERRSLYFAPGKEPKAAKRTAGARARGGS